MLLDLNLRLHLHLLSLHTAKSIGLGLLHVLWLCITIVICLLILLSLALRLLLPSFGRCYYLSEGIFYSVMSFFDRYFLNLHFLTSFCKVGEAVIFSFLERIFLDVAKCLICFPEWITSTHLLNRLFCWIRSPEPHDCIKGIQRLCLLQNRPLNTLKKWQR